MSESRDTPSKIFQMVLFALTLGLLSYFCISDNNLMTLLCSLPLLNPYWLMGAFGCVMLSWMMESFVTKNLVAASYKEEYSFRHAFKVTMVGQYFNLVSPFAAAGQPMQVLALTRQGVTSGIALSALVRKFLVYQISVTVYSMAVILMKYSFFRSKIQGFMALAVAGFLCQCAVVVLLLLFSYSPAFTTKLIHGCVWVFTKLHIVKNPRQADEKVKSQLEYYTKNNREMLGNRRMKVRVYGYTVVQLTAVFAVPFFIYKAFHSPGAPVVDMIAAQSFVTMISTYTPLPGAAGAAEGSFLVIFRIFFREELLRQAMLLWRFIAYYFCIIVGAFFAGMDRKKRRRFRHGE
ncbi:lysylphosphatidylglycerol synthase transmembrane domain-containing protein [Caproiciproducens faecalis]|uniref:Phosphatidylglycerol lysyltransferase n=1 Tax=Caproiciproducens faecalis TaxID=2820301 RepID=A0ABS7DP69_9FIRM|nr:lysylphosphatidylglycerol synthase transmembrane domain-containing protein [Caproiciproducens faecalis]MBW7573100.1 flippase-like domain-containing protein [Caproiciproducens faecalis]